MTFVTVPIAASARSAAVSLLTAYASDAGTKLNVYRGRPRSIQPPHAWVDSLSEVGNLSGPLMRQRTVTADIIVVHGTFDEGNTVDQRDAFVDGFLDWLLDNPHAAGAQTLAGDTVSVTDEPDFVPTWLAPEVQRIYYATHIGVSIYVGG